jgi:HSP20 family protein
VPDTADLALRNLQRLISRDPLLRDIVNPSLPDAKRQARFSPDVDVLETTEGWRLLIELPGVPRDTIGVEVSGARLVVSGRKPAHRGDLPSRVSERATGPFRREFLLPFQVIQEAIRARMENGLLTVDLPRTDAGGKRKVPVE